MSVPGGRSEVAGAAPPSSLAFMFWDKGLFVFPLLLLYTAISYGVFRGKVRATDNR
jgi:cytochrome bd ubiquinol oxidase subunit II